MPETPHLSKNLHFTEFGWVMNSAMEPNQKRKLVAHTRAEHYFPFNFEPIIYIILFFIIYNMLL